MAFFQDKLASLESTKCQKDSAVCQRQSEFFAAMYNMHKDDELCDATLNVDGQEIKVHKVWQPHVGQSKHKNVQLYLC